MFKKLLKILGSFFLVLIVLIVCIGIWFKISSSEYTEKAKPYLENNLPSIVSWEFEQLKPLLTPESLEQFETERGQKVYKMFSKLGVLKSFEEPQFSSALTGVNATNGANNLVKFSILGHFDAGDADIRVTLAKAGDSYLVHYLHINSDVFLVS